jgi:hypothetical protein
VIRKFHLDRKVDVSGVSGVGQVAEGVVFSDGQCAVKWLTDISSLVIYACVEDVEAIHGHGGATTIVFEDPEPDNVEDSDASK